MTLTAEQYAKTMEGTEDAVELPVNENTPPPADPPATPPADPPADPETPPADDTNTPPPADAPPAQALLNLDEELLRISNGEIKSKDEIAAILERAKGYNELETRVKTFEQQNAELKAKTEENPFANDYIKKLNDLTKGGANESQIQAFNLLNRIPSLDALSPMEASSLELQIKHGLTPEEAKTYIYDKYGINAENPDAPLDKSAEIALKVDSTNSREFLKTHLATVSTVPENPAEKMQVLQEQQNQQRIQQIQPIAQNVMNEIVTNAFKGISINGKDGDQAIKIDLPISAENTAAINEAVTRYVTTFDVQPNEEGKKQIADFVKNSMWIQNGEKWLIEAANKRELQVRAEYNNPTGKIDRGTDNPDVGKTSEQKRIDGIAAAVLDY